MDEVTKIEIEAIKEALKNEVKVLKDDLTRLTDEMRDTFEALRQLITTEKVGINTTIPADELHNELHVEGNAQISGKLTIGEFDVAQRFADVASGIEELGQRITDVQSTANTAKTKSESAESEINKLTKHLNYGGAKLEVKTRLIPNEGFQEPSSKYFRFYGHDEKGFFVINSHGGESSIFSQAKDSTNYRTVKIVEGKITSS